MIDAPALERELGGRYRVEGLLGQGGMGQVFRARHLALHRDVAVKVLSGGADLSAGERMLREARIAARIQSPHVVACFVARLTATTGPSSLRHRPLTATGMVLAPERDTRPPPDAPRSSSS